MASTPGYRVQGLSISYLQQSPERLRPLSVRVAGSHTGRRLPGGVRVISDHHHCVSVGDPHVPDVLVGPQKLCVLFLNLL